MSWSWSIGRLAGIPIKIHATFLILLIWVAVAQWVATRQVSEIVTGLAFVISIFACVVLHELGHALAAKRYNIKTQDITLLPIGGVARLERMPDDPHQEIWVALAGPAVNVVIAAVLFGLLLLKPALGDQPLDLVEGSFVQRLMLVNLILVGFNLIPAFPMDGGRVLRGILATGMSYARATRIAATLGQFLALAFGLISFFGNPFLLFIALFVWIGAAQEAQLAEMRSLLGGIPVERAMLTDFRTVSPSNTLGDVIQLILAGSQQDFPVLEDGQVVGVLTRGDLLVGLAKQGQTARVEDVMIRQFKTAEASEPLDQAFSRLQTSSCKTMPVTRFGNLVGLVTLENVGEYVMIKSALEEKRLR